MLSFCVTVAIIVVSYGFSSCVVIILFKMPFTLPSYYHSWEIVKCIVVSHSYEIITGIVTFISLGSTTPPYKILFLDSRTCQTRYGLLGSLTPEPLFVNDPIPPLHLTLKQVSVCTEILH